MIVQKRELILYVEGVGGGSPSEVIPNISKG